MSEQEKPKINDTYFNKNTNGINDHTHDYLKELNEKLKEVLAMVERRQPEMFKKVKEEVKEKAKEEKRDYKAREEITSIEFWQFVCSKSRKEISIEGEKKWRIDNQTALRHGMLCEPLLTFTPYEKTIELLRPHAHIWACQYELSDLKLLECFYNCLTESKKTYHKTNMVIMLDARPWMKDESNKIKYKDCAYWYDKIVSAGGDIIIYEGDDKFKISHQKWIARLPFDNWGNFLTKARESEMIYGSANMTNASKQNLESAFYFPAMSKLLRRQLFLDLAKMSKLPNTVSWQRWKRRHPTHT